MNHEALAKIDKLDILYAEQRATLSKMVDYVQGELAKNRQRQQQLNGQRKRLATTERIAARRAASIL